MKEKVLFLNKYYFSISEEKERNKELLYNFLYNSDYKDFNINIIEAKRNINSNGKKRGKVEEVIITNYVNKKGFE